MTTPTDPNSPTITPNILTAPLTPMGKMIVVLDEGFVYVGEVIRDAEFTMITQAKNIRRWGTTKGLGELRNGPTKETVCDDAGTLIVPMGRVVFFMKCQNW